MTFIHMCIVQCRHLIHTKCEPHRKNERKIKRKSNRQVTKIHKRQREKDNNWNMPFSINRLLESICIQLSTKRLCYFYKKIYILFCIASPRKNIAKNKEKNRDDARAASKKIIHFAFE